MTQAMRARFTLPPAGQLPESAEEGRGAAPAAEGGAGLRLADTPGSVQQVHRAMGLPVPGAAAAAVEPRQEQEGCARAAAEPRTKRAKR